MKTTINENPIVNKCYDAYKKAETFFERKQILHEALSLLETRDFSDLLSWVLNDIELKLNKLNPNEKNNKMANINRS